MKYLKSYIFYNESVRDFLKPKSKEEVIKQLGGRENVVFKPTNKYLEQSVFIGKYETSYKNLVKIFGKPNGEGDNYKISTEWVLEDDKGNIVSISDYKMTNLYDSSYPSVYKFRNELSYDWNIFSDNKEILKDLKTYIYIKELSLNESIKQFLKPKSEDDIRKALNKLSINKKLFYIFEHNLLYLYSNEQLKELMSKDEPENQINFIYDYGLQNDLYSNDQIIEIMSKINPFEQISLIYDWGMLGYLFNQEYVKNLVYNSSENAYDQLDTIYNRFFDELKGIFTNDDIKNIVSKDHDNPEKMINNIDEFYLNEIYTTEEIKNILNKFNNTFDKLLCICNYNLYQYFSKKDIINMFKSLNDEQQRYLIGFDDLYDILPVSISKKFD